MVIKMKCTHQATKQKGFTLIELMVVIAIMAILLALAVPNMSKFLAQWRQASAITAFSGSLRQARSEAIKSSRIVTMCPSSDQASCTNSTDFSNGWIIYLDANNNDSLTAGEKILHKEAKASGTTIGSNTPKKFSFLPNGLLKSAPGTITFTSSGVDNKTIKINRAGRIYKSD